MNLENINIAQYNKIKAPAIKFIHITSKINMQHILPVCTKNLTLSVFGIAKS